jgi:hypothetical protein
MRRRSRYLYALILAVPIIASFTVATVLRQKRDSRLDQLAQREFVGLRNAATANMTFADAQIWLEDRGYLIITYNGDPVTEYAERTLQGMKEYQKVEGRKLIGTSETERRWIAVEFLFDADGKFVRFEAHKEAVAPSKHVRRAVPATRGG